MATQCKNCVHFRIDTNRCKCDPPQLLNPSGAIGWPKMDPENDATCTQHQYPVNWFNNHYVETRYENP